MCVDKVSIVVPVYNVEKYVERCLNSLLNQSYKDIEIILVDDCSSDNSIQNIKKVCAGDLRCKIIYHDHNKGLAAARNTGIKHSSGKWLMFVDSDDWIDLYAVEKLVNSAKKNQSDIVLVDSSKVYESGKVVRENFLKKIDNNTRKEVILTKIEQMGVTRKLIKKDLIVLNNLMFIETIKRSEDIPVTYPLLEQAKKISVVNESLYYYMQRENSLSHCNKMCDVSFYDEIETALYNRCRNIKSQEFEYRMIFELLYGRTYIMIDGGYSFSMVKEKINEFCQKYPKWKENKYLKQMNFLRKIFIYCADYQWLSLCKMLIRIKKRIM